jgi:hypothetical protein
MIVYLRDPWVFLSDHNITQYVINEKLIVLIIDINFLNG